MFSENARFYGWLQAGSLGLQSESAKPTFGVTLERDCNAVMIEKKIYYNVTIELKAAEMF